ncbi:SOS response-associated peptidase [Labrys wisconsinensis]|uniref:Abasic site processing protein n=1 Tax=Labrys wisconsinensis TaxID=425677 RepID=A0ABU0JH91_9HYPH|nr:SOS response-associated peptidase [Labrys wisconsinensis]MDQ0472846.1 putative SOS response-associated peptidase YedK [Labrys wisconsinensis]
MCNLYSLTTTQAALRALRKAIRDQLGNLDRMPSIFPDGFAPVIRNTPDGEELIRMRWGFPPVAGPLVTNVRNVSSGYWRPWLKPAQRCLVPANAFCEYDEQNKKRPTWFALDESRPTFCFAGIWRPWSGVRGTKANPVEGEHLLYSFLTCEPNDIVAPVHPKAMPVLLTTEEERETWMTAPAEEALQLQRPLSNDALKIVATGKRSDGDVPDLPPAAPPPAQTSLF